MSVFPVFVDSRPTYFGEVETSLLQMPYGHGTILTYLRDHVSPPDAGAPHVLAAFNPPPGYEEAIRRSLPHVGSIVGSGRFGRLLDEFEPSDWLLLIDPAQFPRDGYVRRDLLHLIADTHPVRHMVSTDRGSDCAQERVLLDERGAVRRIQRYYAGVTWVDSCAVSYSLVSASAARVVGDHSVSSLGDLRHILMTRGISTRDWFLSNGTIDLRQEYGLLHLSDLNLQQAESRGQRVTPRENGCTVDKTARLRGPCTLQNGVVVEANALIIGPTVIGARARIGRDAVVAQCVVAEDTVVPPGAQLRHHVLLPNHTNHEARVCAQREPAAALRDDFVSDGHTTRGAARSRLGTRAFLATKRCVDTLLALVGLILLSPLMLLTAVAIKLTSPGPILFGHERESGGGRGFKCWKFRTMVSDAHAMQRELYRQNKLDGPQFKMTSDPRITPLGRILRNSNVDELPQLLNVLKGDMSLIGPRPSPFRENQICVPWRQARLSVRPGITGLWQVCRSDRATGDFHQWIYFDTLYVRHMSVALDLKILLATILTLGGRWSMPLEWLISARRLNADASATLPSRVPMLADGDMPVAPAAD